MAIWQAPSLNRSTVSSSVPGDPGPYSAAALLAGTSAAQRKQLIATHKVTIESHANYLKVEEAGKELILYAVGDDALAPLKKQYIGFGDETVLTILSIYEQRRPSR